MNSTSWEKAKNIFEQAMVVAPDERGRVGASVGAGRWLRDG